MKTLNPFHLIYALLVLATAALPPAAAQSPMILRRVADLNPGTNGSFPTNFTVYGGALFFSAYTTNTGWELWRYDTAGIMLVSNINDTMSDIGFGVMIGNDSAPAGLTEFNGELYFSAFDLRRGGELWRTDGAQVVRVADINPDANDTIKVLPASSWPNGLTVLDNTLYFSADGGGPRTNYELWQYDGVSVKLVANIHPDIGSNYSCYPQGFTALNGQLFFMADDGVNGFELWKYNGTNALLMNINPGNLTSSSYPKYLVPVNHTLYFQAFHDSFGYELWKSDGNSVALVTNLSPGASSAFPEQLTAFHDQLYFSATDGTRGFELWKYDGASATLVSNINAAADAYPRNLTVFNQGLCFAANDGVHGWELWHSDGTNAGLVTNLNPSGDSFPESLTVFNGTLYFVATTPATGYEIWKYDGTNVTLAADINPGPGSSFPQLLTPFRNELCFRAASDGVSDWELWSLSSPITPPTPVTLQTPAWMDAQLTVSFASEPGRTYEIQSTDTLRGGIWQTLITLTGTGSTLVFTNANSTAPQTFFRVEAK